MRISRAPSFFEAAVGSTQDRFQMKRNLPMLLLDLPVVVQWTES
jgi:hypothetical protein